MVASQVVVILPMALSAEVAEVGHGRSLHMPLPPAGKACEPDAA